MRLYSSVSVFALCLCIVALRYQAYIRQNWMPDTEASSVVNMLAPERRLHVMASATVACLRDIPGQGMPVDHLHENQFCSCKVAELATFLVPSEVISGIFVNVQREIDHRLDVQKIVTKCAREAIDGL